MANIVISSLDITYCTSTAGSHKAGDFRCPHKTFRVAQRSDKHPSERQGQESSSNNTHDSSPPRDVDPRLSTDAAGR